MRLMPVYYSRFYQVCQPQKNPDKLMPGLNIGANRDSGDCPFTL